MMGYNQGHAYPSQIGAKHNSRSFRHHFGMAHHLQDRSFEIIGQIWQNKLFLVINQTREIHR
jgi:hypothetical protein